MNLDQKPTMEKMSQDQNQNQAHENEAQPDAQQVAGDAPAPKKRSSAKAVKITPESEAAISPRPSFWPLVLAIALSLTLLGFVLDTLIVVGIGAVFIVASIIGWALERR